MVERVAGRTAVGIKAHPYMLRHGCSYSDPRNAAAIEACVGIPTETLEIAALSVTERPAALAEAAAKQAKKFRRLCAARPFSNLRLTPFGQWFCLPERYTSAYVLAAIIRAHSEARPGGLMDWSIFYYFLAAVVAAGVSYAIWPKNGRPPLNIIGDEGPIGRQRARRHRRAA
jgi:hypothetical protein